MSGYRCGVAVFKVGGVQKDRHQSVRVAVPTQRSPLHQAYTHTRLRARPTFLYTRGWNAMFPDVTILSMSFGNGTETSLRQTAVSIAFSTDSPSAGSKFRWFKALMMDRQSVPETSLFVSHVITFSGTQGAAARILITTDTVR